MFIIQLYFTKNILLTGGRRTLPDASVSHRDQDRSKKKRRR
jgi:hypothetical protein